MLIFRFAQPVTNKSPLQNEQSNPKQPQSKHTWHRRKTTYLANSQRRQGQQCDLLHEHRRARMSTNSVPSQYFSVLSQEPVIKQFLSAKNFTNETGASCWKLIRASRVARHTSALPFSIGFDLLLTRSQQITCLLQSPENTIFPSPEKHDERTGAV